MRCLLSLISGVIFIAVLAGIGLGWFYFGIEYPVRYRPEIRQAITETWGTNQVAEMEPLVLALVRTESSFEPRSRSTAGAIGLMQLMPATARQVARTENLTEPTDEQLYDPATNLKFGTLYLKEMMAAFPNDLDLALAAYNGGPGMAATLNSGGSIAAETDNYLTVVKRRRQGYVRRLSWPIGL